MDGQAREEWLTGPGAGGGTVRVGDTVRRRPERAPAAMLLTLRYLEQRGFEHSPRVLGRDAEGRWILSYIEGTAAVPPYEPWVSAAETIASTARLLRRYHDTIAPFRPPVDVQWPRQVPTAFGGTLVAHLDVSMANVVFRGYEAVALIDFEEVGLASRVWDVARTARHWVPLLDPADLPEPLRGLAGHEAERLRLFADEYGLAPADRARLVEAVLANADDSYENMRRGAAAGHPGYQREWAGYPAARNRRGRAWVAAHAEELRAAIRAPRR